MKKFFQAALLPLLLLLSSADASLAGPAAPFRGVYDVLNDNLPPEKRPHLLIDVDTIDNIWINYGDGGPLPESLVPYRAEMAILAGFTHVDFLILTLERTAFLDGNFMRIEGAGDTLMEIKRRPDGLFDAGTRKNGIISRYLLSAPQPLGSQPAASGLRLR